MDRLPVVISWALASLVVSRRIPSLWKPDMKRLERCLLENDLDRS